METKRMRKLFRLTVYVLMLVTLGGMIVRSFPGDGVKMLAAGTMVFVVAYLSFLSGLLMTKETKRRLGFDDNDKEKER